jgi:hypothetical protein
VQQVPAVEGHIDRGTPANEKTKIMKLFEQMNVASNVCIFIK